MDQTEPRRERPERVERRQEPQQSIDVVGVQHFACADHVRSEVVVRERHALRFARRSAGEQDREHVVTARSSRGAAPGLDGANGQPERRCERGESCAPSDPLRHVFEEHRFEFARQLDLGLLQERAARDDGARACLSRRRCDGRGSDRPVQRHARFPGECGGDLRHSRCCRTRKERARDALRAPRVASVARDRDRAREQTDARELASHHVAYRESPRRKARGTHERAMGERSATRTPRALAQLDDLRADRARRCVGRERGAERQPNRERHAPTNVAQRFRARAREQGTFESVEVYGHDGRGATARDALYAAAKGLEQAALRELSLGEDAHDLAAIEVRAGFAQCAQHDARPARRRNRDDVECAVERSQPDFSVPALVHEEANPARHEGHEDESIDECDVVRGQEHSARPRHVLETFDPGAIHDAHEGEEGAQDDARAPIGDLAGPGHVHRSNPMAIPRSTSVVPEAGSAAARRS